MKRGQRELGSGLLTLGLASFIVLLVPMVAVGATVVGKVTFDGGGQRYSRGRWVRPGHVRDAVMDHSVLFEHRIRVRRRP
jgi:hypothetical protein